MLRRIFSDIRNLISFNRNFRISQTNIFLMPFNSFFDVEVVIVAVEEVAVVM